MPKTSKGKNVTVEKKEKFPLEGKCRPEDIICKCVVTATGHPRNFT